MQRIKDQCIAQSIIYESFGNAVTTLNNNASRFSIFQKLLYNVPQQATEASFIGMYSETYLLEYNRVIRQAPNERNFHIPYMLYNGIPTDEHEKYGILHLSQWNYINRMDYQYKIPNIDIKDAERFHQLKVNFYIYIYHQ